MSPQVSVLMPVRNAAMTLRQALGSIRRQRGVDWECVVVDDGSSDDSRACLERAATLDPRIRVAWQAPAGIVEALNHGLRLCRGEYVARMDADDIMHRDRLQLQARCLDMSRGLAGVGSHLRIFPRPARGTGRREYESWLNSLTCEADVSRDAFVECPLAHPSLMLRREVLERYAYRDRGWPEDYDLILRLLADQQRLGVVPKRLLCWRDGASRLSRTSSDYSIARFTACKAHFLARSHLAEQPQYILWGYGKTGRELARALAQHDKHPLGIVELHPGRIGQRILGAPVITPAQLPELRSRSGPLPIVVSVARPGPRGEVRAALGRLGLVELRDYVCAA
jgi:glycosyltransferase involved in cell wall biosynthesis